MKTAYIQRALLMLIILSTGCSIRRVAVNKLGSALASGGSTFASDDDPELIRGAVPFSLKLMESLLAESPRHRGMLLAACRGFTQYAYAFIQEDADEVEGRDITAANVLRARARRMYLRARDYGLRGLTANHPGFDAALRQDPKSEVNRLRSTSDVSLLYWTAASWGSAISVSKNDPDLLAEQPVVEALIDRALQLDDRFEFGAIHGFLIAYEPSRQGIQGDPTARSRKHFERAMELSQGRLASPYLSLAETVSVVKQDKAEFQSLLHRALAINPDASPAWRLENLVMQRRARWLLSRVDELFIESDESVGKGE